MKNPRPARLFNRKATHELLKTAHTYTKLHDWRQGPALTQNPVLMRELYRIANNDPRLVRQLLEYCQRYLLQTVLQLKRTPIPVTDPTHPTVVNNINHPLNPSNPANLMLNPGLNLIFQQNMAEEDAVKLDEEYHQLENTKENDVKQGEILKHLITDEFFLQAAERGLHAENTVEPHQALGLTPNASPEEVETRSLTLLAEVAPEPHEEPTKEFHAVAAAVATVALTIGHHLPHQLEHLVGKEEEDEFLKKSLVAPPVG